MSDAPTPNSLVTVLQAAQVLKVSEQTVRNDVARLDIQAEHTIEVKGTLVKLYYLKSLTEARAKIVAEADERRKTGLAPKPPSSDASDAVQTAFKSVGADLNELTDTIAELKGMAMKLMEQNAHLFKALANIQTCLHQPAIQLPVVETTPPTKVEPTSPPKPALPKICIAGIWAVQQQMIQKEFGDVFDLRMFDADQATSASFAKTLESCDRVLLLTNFINHTIENKVKQSKAQYSHVRGGMTMLRDRLTTLFVELTPLKAKA